MTTYRIRRIDDGSYLQNLADDAAPNFNDVDHAAVFADSEAASAVSERITRVYTDTTVEPEYTIADRESCEHCQEYWRTGSALRCPTHSV